MHIVTSDESRSRELVLLVVSPDGGALRQRLSSLLRGDAWRLEWVAEAATAQRCIDATTPTLALVNAELPGPGPSGFELCRELRARCRDSATILLLTQPTIEIRLAAFEAEADDCLSQPFDLRELTARSNALVRRIAVEPPFQRLLSSSPAHCGVPDEQGSELITRVKSLSLCHGLSLREQQILLLVARGGELKAMGSQLGCSYPTVRTHLRRMARKLGCSTTREILIYLFSRQLDPKAAEVSSK